MMNFAMLLRVSVVLVALAIAPGCPVSGGGTIVTPGGNPLASSVYMVYFIPLYQEIGVPPRAYDVRKRACYVFPASDPNIGKLFLEASKVGYFPISDPGNEMGDCRIMLEDTMLHRELVITRDYHVLTTDSLHFFDIPKEFVKRVAKILSEEAKGKPKADKSCFPPVKPVRKQIPGKYPTRKYPTQVNWLRTPQNTPQIPDPG